MPVTQRKRSFQLFRKLKFSHTSSASGTDEDQLEIDKMILHVLDCLGALQCVMGRYDPSRAKVFWGAVCTIAEIGVDSAIGHVDKRHPGASHLLRAFPNDQKATDGRGWLPLHWAAVIDNVDVKDVRNIARADPLATMKGYNQPISANPGHLTAAVRHPNMEVVRCLYDFYPRMASSRDNEGDLPIHYAARYSESTEMIRFLLQANSAGTRARGESNLVPLQCALYNESPERFHIVKCLLDADPFAATIVNGDGDTALHLAVDQECPRELLEHLIASNPDAVRTQNDIGLLPLHIACYSKQSERALDTVQLLLSAYPEGATVAGVHGHLPAHYAAEFSTTEVLKCIVNAHVDGIHTGCALDNNDTPLFKAVSSNNEETVRYIVENFPETVNHSNQHRLTPLHIAAEGDNLNIMKLLHANNPENIKKQDDEGRTPLMVFAQVHQDLLHENDREADCLRFLLSHYPEAVLLEDINHETPLSLCSPENLVFRRLLLRSSKAAASARGVTSTANNNNSASTTANASSNSSVSDELRNINYENRRYGMFLAFAAINADGIPNIFSRLRGKDIHLLREALSYL